MSASSITRQCECWWAWWWLSALTAPLWPCPGLDPDHGGRLWLVLVAAAAVLGAAATLPRRAGRWLWLAWWVCVGVGWETWRCLAVRDAQPWLFVQGAWWDVTGWWLIGFAGARAVYTHALSPARWLPGMLCAFLSFNLVASALERVGISRWSFIAAPYSGVFAGAPAYAAWCAISLPVLWAWRAWAILPALAGLVVCPTTSAWVAAGVWGFRKVRGWERMALVMSVLIGIFWQEPLLREAVWQRLVTWDAVMRTIAAHWTGIGWWFGSYRMVTLGARGAILPHPASDVLMLPLRYGWWTLPLLASGAWWLWRRRASAWREALGVAALLACWQTSVSLPAVAALVCVLWLTERIEHGKAQPSVAA